LTLATARAWSRKYALWHIINKGNDMIEVFKVKENKLLKLKLQDDQLERVCLHVAGGGLTAIQTAKAMEYSHKLRKDGKFTANGYVVELIGD